MSYDKIRIHKLQSGGMTPREIELELIRLRKQMSYNAYQEAKKLINPELKLQMMEAAQAAMTGTQNDLEMLSPQAISTPTTYVPLTKITADSSNLVFNNDTNKVDGNIELKRTKVNPEEFFAGVKPNTTEALPDEYNADDKDAKAARMQKASMAMGIVGEAAVAAVNQVDNATMGDKNFSASSQAIDQAVHGVSGALMKSGNPYAMAAGVALEGINFATKAGGQNVQGYNVDINNSGYGNLGHQESEAGRVWDKWSGVTALKLKKRNEKARMALAAADISSDQAFEQEARANSVTNVLQQNQIALAGGIDTSLLSS